MCKPSTTFVERRRSRRNTGRTLSAIKQSVEIHQEEPIQSFATKSDQSGKFFGAKFKNSSFNIQIVNCPVTKMASRSKTSHKHLRPGQTNATLLNIIEFDFVGWCWTAWPNECNMLCGADTNFGD